MKRWAGWRTAICCLLSLTARLLAAKALRRDAVALRIGGPIAGSAQLAAHGGEHPANGCADAHPVVAADMKSHRRAGLIQHQGTGVAFIRESRDPNLDRKSTR